MKIDKWRFFPIILIITAVLVSVTYNLPKVQALVDTVYASLSGNFGWFFIFANLCTFLFSLWIIFGPYKNVTLGGDDAKPQYSTISWAGMMFTTSCSAGLVVFGFTETLYYASAPPFQLEPFSISAYEYAEVYTHFHWGLYIQAIFVPASIAIGYMLYNRDEKRISMSTAVKPILGKYSNGILGCFIDILGTFGAVVAPVTSMGLGLPLLTLLLQNIFNIPDENLFILQTTILIIWIAVFGTSVYRGLEKGIKNLSNINIALAFAVMIYVGFLTGIFTIFKSELNTMGLYLTNFIRMATYTDPYGDGLFVQNWTVWYCAWMFVFMPLMGVFNTRISKGRTLREIALAQILGSSLGCWIATMTLGNYSIKLQQSGMDIAEILNEKGQAAAILEILNTMPFPKIMMVVLAILCFVFLATTVDSSSYVAAETTMLHDTSDKQAPRWSRLLWAAIECIIVLVLLQVGGFNAVQLLTILVGFPLAIITFLLIASIVKALHDDHDTT